MPRSSSTRSRLRRSDMELIATTEGPLGQCPLNRPSRPQPEDNRCAAYAGAIRPLGQGRRLPVVRQDSVVAAVIILLLACGPSAVRRLVVPVGVDSVERHPVWALPHIFKEGQERVSPPLAHRYPATAIHGIASCPGVVAPTFHGDPGVVRGGLGAAVSFSVKTAAAACVAAPEVWASNVALFPAVATACPSPRSSCSTLLSPSEHDEASESTALHLNRGRHA